MVQEVSCSSRPKRHLNCSPELYQRSLVALCGMVVHDAEYQSQQTKRQRSACHVAASIIARKVLSSVGLQTKGQYLAFMTNPAVDPTFKGEEVSVYELLKEFRRL